MREKRSKMMRKLPDEEVLRAGEQAPGVGRVVPERVGSPEVRVHIGHSIGFQAPTGTRSAWAVSRAQHTARVELGWGNARERANKMGLLYRVWPWMMARLFCSPATLRS